MKRFLIVLSALFLLIALFVALAPTFISSTFGKNVLLSQVNRKIDGQLTVESLDLSWLAGQSIKGVRLTDRNGKMIVALDEIDADSSLLGVLFSHSDPEPFHLRNLEAEIGQDVDGVTNLQALLGLKKSRTSDFSRATVLLSKVNADLLKVGPNDWSLKAAGLTKQNEIRGQFDLTASLGNNLNVTMQAQNFPVLFIDQTLSIKKPELSGVLPRLLGNSFDLHVDLTHSDNGQNFHLIGKSPYTNLNFVGALEDGVLSVNPSSQLSFAIPQEQLNQLLKQEKKLQLQQPFSGKLVAHAFKLPILAPEQANIDLTFTLDPVTLSALDDKQKLSLKDSTITASNKSNQKSLLVNVNAAGAANSDPFSLNLAFELPSHFLANPDLKGLLKEGILTKGALNSPLNATWNGTVKEHNSSFDIGLGYQGYSINNLHILVDQLSIDNKNGVSVLVNSNGDDNVSGSFYFDDMTAKNFHINMSLSSFNPTFLEKVLPDQPVQKYVGSSIDAKIVASRQDNGDVKSVIEIQAPKETDGFLKKLNAKFNLEPDYDVTFEISSQQKVGSFNVTGTTQDLFDSKGSLNLQNALVTLKGTTKHFPIALIAQIATGDKELSKKMEALIGTQIDADFSAEIRQSKGPLKASLKGVNGSANIEGVIAQNGFTLTSPLTASLKITPQLERMFLRDSLPLLSSAVSSDVPIELTIATEGFILPLPSPSLQNVQIGSAVLDLHKIQFTRDGQLGKVASLLGITQNNFEVWFTPIYLSLTQGYLDMRRVDMLIANTYPLASWGVVDFNKEALKITIGLTPAALLNAFKVTTSNSYMLQIPVRGPISKPEIDTAKVTTRISSLVAQSRGGPEGLVLGTVLDAASGAYTEDRPPAPTTDPLPWKTTIEQKKSDNESLPEKILDAPEKIIEQPIKELQKGTKKLLKGLFG